MCITVLASYDAECDIKIAGVVGNLIPGNSFSRAAGESISDPSIKLPKVVLGNDKVSAQSCVALGEATWLGRTDSCLPNIPPAGKPDAANLEPIAPAKPVTAPVLPTTFFYEVWSLV